MTAPQLFKQLKEELRKYLHPFDEELLTAAYEFGKKAHAGQKRKSGELYITHPLGAALILTKMKVDLPTIITCILHDVPEDTEYTIEDIEERFGEQIAELVAGITKLSAVYYKHNMRDRQIDTLRRMFLVMAKDIRVVLVKLADRLHNIRTLQHVKPEKATRIAKETMEIFSPLANLLGVWEIRQEMDDLCFRYVYKEEFEKVQSAVMENRKKRKDYLKKVTKKVQDLIRQEKLDADIKGRWKHLFSIYKKMQRNQKKTPYLYDMPVIRIVLKSVEDCYKVVGMIHNRWKPQPNRFRDYIAVPKPNGYQSLHTTVFGPGGDLVDFQIRTEDMDLRANYGVASEFIHRKNGKDTDINTFLEKTPWVKKVLKLQSKSNIEFMEDLKLNVLSDRVFVFDKDGTAIDMPHGSSPLDFAYQLSPAIGNKYSYAVVNKEKKPMSYELQTGDIVEIHTDKNIKPDREWLYFVITDEAKEAIKKVFKKRSRSQRQELGEMILDNVCYVINKSNFRNLPKKRQMRIADIFKCKKVEELLVMVGSGEITEKNLTRLLVQNKDEVFRKPRISLERLFDRLFRSKKYDRLQVCIKLELEDRIGLLSDIFDVFAHHRINITRLVAREVFFKRGHAAIDYIFLEVENLNQLRRAMRSLEGIDGVENVTQRTRLEYLSFYTAMVIATIIWIGHPFIISEFAHGMFANQAAYLRFFWFSGLVMILIMFYLRKWALSHMPKPIGRRRFVIFTNFTAILVIGTLISELPVFNLDFSLITFGPIVLAFMIAGLVWSK